MYAVVGPRDRSFQIFVVLVLLQALWQKKGCHCIFQSSPPATHCILIIRIFTREWPNAMSLGLIICGCLRGHLSNGGW